MTQPILVPGAVYRLKHNGLCEYVGTDVYYGQTTFMFKRLEYYPGERMYLLPEVLPEYLGATDPTEGGPA